MSCFRIKELVQINIKELSYTKVISAKCQFQNMNLQTLGWLNENFPQGGGRNFKLQQGELEKMPATKHESSNARLVANETELVEEAMREIEIAKDIITPHKVAIKIKNPRSTRDQGVTNMK